MPRLIDHAERDREIADAAMRVLERDGLMHLSVRGVAAEAGLATASLRRAFPTQDALRRHCLQLIRDRAAARITALEGEGRPLVVAMLAELLPLDHDRRVELAAQVQLGALALTDPGLAADVVALDAEVRIACAAAISELVRTGEIPPRSDPEGDAELLHAALDGFAVHLLWRREPVAAEAATRTLARILDRLLSIA